MCYFVKDWASFQHYKDRNPPWVKLHKSLLDDYDFQCLPVASKALAPMLWLLASEHKDPSSGKIDGGEEKIIFRLRMTKEDFHHAIKPLIDKGFISCGYDASVVLAESKQVAVPETETEAYREETETDNITPIIPFPEKPKKEKQNARKRATYIDDNFQPDIESLRECSRLGIDSDPREFIDYWKGVGKPMCDWQATFRNNVRRLERNRKEREQRTADGRQGPRDVVGAALRAAEVLRQREN